MFPALKILQGWLRQTQKFWILIVSALFGLLFISHLFANSQTVHLTIAAGPKREASYKLAQSLAEKLETSSPNLSLNVLETRGSDENLKLLEDKRVDLASIPTDAALSSSLRLVSYLFGDYFQIIVSEKSGIQSIVDLKGKRVVVPPLEDRADEFFWILLDHYGLSKDDLTVRQLLGEASDAAFLAGEADAVFRVRPAGSPYIQKLVQIGKGRIIPIDQAAALKIRYPEFLSVVLPKGVYQGFPAIPDADLPTISVPRLLVSRADVSEDAVNEITRVLYEYRQFFTNQMPLADQIRPPVINEGVPVPVHAGAQSYYDRDKPSILAENADLIGLGMTVSVGVLSWFWQLQKRLTTIQKNRSDNYNSQLLHLIERIKHCNDMDAIYELRDESYDQFATVIQAFDRDELSTESLLSIRFTWEATMNALQDQEAYLLRRKN